MDPAPLVTPLPESSSPKGDSAPAEPLAQPDETATPASSSQPPAGPPIKKSSKSPLNFILPLLLMITVGVAAYAFGRSQGGSIANLPTVAPSTEPQACTMEAKLCPDGSSVGRTGPNCEFAECPADTNSASLPTGWQYMNFDVCNTELPLPPRNDPYIGKAGSDPATGDEGFYWNARLSEAQAESTEMFPNFADVMFTRPDGLGSGYVAGAVVVTCNQNTENYTTAELYDAYAESFATLQASSSPGALTLSKLREEKLWGREVAVIRITGGMYAEDDEQFLMATPTHIYRINKVSMSSDPFVQQTTNQIFQLLKFE